MKANITTKQAGVIYGNWKRGNIEATREDMDFVYRYADRFTAQTTDSKVADVVDRLCACIDAIFANDFDTAKAELDGARRADARYFTAA